MDAGSMMADLSDEETAEREVALDDWFRQTSCQLETPNWPPPRPITDPEEWEKK